MRQFFRKAAVIVAACIPVFGLMGASASAKTKPKAAHPQILIRCSPNPLIETSASAILVVCQVEANPSFAGSTVTISSTQLTNHCENAVYLTMEGGTPSFVRAALNSLTVTLDNDGNATVMIIGANCAPGSDLIEASLNAPPFVTAITKLILVAPQTTPPGVKGFPANEVETGDGGVGQGTFGVSNVYAVFYVETNPVFAEQIVTITSNELTARCGLGYHWQSFGGGPAPNNFADGPFATPVTGVVTSATIDNDGNAAFLFLGASCAAGKSTVIAEVQNNGPTYSTQYTILPPAVTI